MGWGIVSKISLRFFDVLLLPSCRRAVGYFVPSCRAVVPSFPLPLHLRTYAPK